MAKKQRDSKFDDYQKLQNEIIREKVNEVFRDHPEDYIAKLEELGFKYYDDDIDYEEIEERDAKPENQRQRDLVAFFENGKEPSEEMFVCFSEEKGSEEINYPLIRKYFKRANQNLKALILYGLEKYPGRIDLLDDLAYFHEFENVLSLLIKYYTRECLHQANLETFSELAQDFYYSTNPDGFEAYYSLREMLEPESGQRKIIDALIAEMEEEEKTVDSIDFE